MPRCLLHFTTAFCLLYAGLSGRTFLLRLLLLLLLLLTQHLGLLPFAFCIRGAPVLCLYPICHCLCFLPFAVAAPRSSAFCGASVLCIFPFAFAMPWSFVLPLHVCCAFCLRGALVHSIFAFASAAPRSSLKKLNGAANALKTLTFPIIGTLKHVWNMHFGALYPEAFQNSALAAPWGCILETRLVHLRCAFVEVIRLGDPSPTPPAGMPNLARSCQILLDPVNR